MPSEEIKQESAERLRSACSGLPGPGLLDLPKGNLQSFRVSLPDASRPPAPSVLSHVSEPWFDPPGHVSTPAESSGHGNLSVPGAHGTEYVFQAFQGMLSNTALTERFRRGLIPPSPEHFGRGDILGQIQHAKNEEKVLHIMGRAGFSRQAESFRQDLMDCLENEEEGEHPGVNLDSLKASARFLVNCSPPYSDLDMDADGNVGMEWLLSPSQAERDPDAEFWGDGQGYMAIRFVSSKAIEFAMLSGPWHEEKERLNVSGRFSHRKMNKIVEMFAERMVEYA